MGSSQFAFQTVDHNTVFLSPYTRRCNGRKNRREEWFAKARRVFFTFDKVHVNRVWRIFLPAHPILVEIILFRYTVFKSHLAKHGVPYAIDDRTFSHICRRIRIDNNPDRPFDYVFLDEYTGKLHKSEERFQKLFTSFTFLAIAVACLGLFGLVTALSDSKTKEIGIRKVLGSSVTGIIGLLSKQFVGLVLVAFIIATPVSVLIMRAWLDGFAYHVELQWQALLTAGAMTCVIAMATVCFQSLKAAIANPVDSLRNE